MSDRADSIALLLELANRPVARKGRLVLLDAIEYLANGGRYESRRGEWTVTEQDRIEGLVVAAELRAVRTAER